MKRQPDGDLKQALLGCHAFINNDNVSSYFTKGKAASWKIVKNERFIKELQESGLLWKIP